jgi:ribonuclease Z
LKVTIIGTGSATPSLLRNPSAQLLSDDHETYLIDCGEGTQNELIKLKVKVNKIKNIFISHLHGDHYFGLIGLISSLNLSHRTEPLTIFGPKGLDEIITIQLKYAGTSLHFKLEFIAIDTETEYVIIDNEHITVSTIPLIHRIPCCGFLFYEKPKKRNIIKEKLPSNITIDEIITLKNGVNVYNIDNSVKYYFNELTLESSGPKKYAYCSDTAYSEKIVSQIAKVNLLYHEATFKEDLLHRAYSTQHSTAKQAAKIAKLANVGKLLIGHFSSRYHNLSENLLEAKEVFENTELAIEQQVYEV